MAYVSIPYFPPPDLPELDIKPAFPVVIFGSRSVTERQVLRNALAKCPFTSRITEVVSGKARGADQMGESWAEHMKIPVVPFPAKWRQIPEGCPAHLIGHWNDGTPYYKPAGHDRNLEMLRYVYVRNGGVIGLWDHSKRFNNSGSKGTKQMIEAAKAKLPEDRVFVYTFDDYLKDTGR